MFDYLIMGLLSVNFPLTYTFVFVEVYHIIHAYSFFLASISLSFSATIPFSSLTQQQHQQNIRSNASPPFRGFVFVFSTTFRSESQSAIANPHFTA